jgi:hypothetical protein
MGMKSYLKTVVVNICWTYSTCRYILHGRYNLIWLPIVCLFYCASGGLLHIGKLIGVIVCRPEYQPVGVP